MDLRHRSLKSSSCRITATRVLDRSTNGRFYPKVCAYNAEHEPSRVDLRSRGGFRRLTHKGCSAPNIAQGERQLSTTAIVPPGGNRYKYTEALTAKAAPCKVTSQDSGGALSAFENVTPPKQGPPLHRHHREDEWFYVATGTFVFEIDGKRTEFGQGGSIFAPCELPHRWANTGDEPAILLVTLFPGGFEAFFDEMSEALAKGHVSHEQQRAIYASHQMDLLGPKLFA